MEPAGADRTERARARQSWLIERHRLESTACTNLRRSTTAAERLAMMWELARQSWFLAGRPFPEYTRAEIPGKLVRSSR